MIKFDFRQNAALYQLIAGLAGVTLILIGCIVVLQPFFPAALLAVIFTLATWPAYDWIRVKMRHNGAWASALMTLLLAACFLAPLIIIGTSIAENYERIYSTVQTSLRADPQITARRLGDLPYVGEYLERIWLRFASDRQGISEYLQRYSQQTTEILLKVGRTMGAGLFDVTLGIVIAYFLFRHGTAAAERMGALIDRFGGEHGRRLLDICKNTLTGVVYGLLGTALAQGGLAAIGFWIAGVPGATFLGLMTFFLSIVPVGPPLIWVPAALWLFSEDMMWQGVFLSIWGLLVISMIDNVMKPWFISRGSKLPFLLVLLGIIGGVLAFGFIGVFIGPTLLALSYSLVMEWSTVRKVAGGAGLPGYEKQV